MAEQKYKIYINGIPVFLTSTQEAQKMGFKADNNNLIAPYVGKKKMFLQYYDKLHKDKMMESVLIYADDVEAMWQDFLEKFVMLEAAGGYVQNKNGELLVFYRRGCWDMPKGKIDKGETPEVAALREVNEETGLINLTLGDFIGHTYHTYEQKDKRILKKTWWYKMQTTDMETVPQTEEDIEKIEWVEPKAWLAGGPHVYPNIREIISMV